MRFIQSAQEAGFSLEEVKELLEEPQTETPFAERLRQLARRRLPDVEALIARATTMKRLLEAGLACECSSLEACLLFVQSDGPDITDAAGPGD